eukprot:TRINITY_DN1522_c0_g2_i1.p2 TRINITY_DN1522_c0_g2~~TRINITY_DN1522_c0_g2_i1.p2  ORF type:complete len:112 (-),score=32.09 TRINITY_DN1522_c0_g2_i1:83-418(-)
MLQEVAKEIQSIHHIFSASPIFGIINSNSSSEDKTQQVDLPNKPKRKPDDVEILEDDGYPNDSFLSYCTDIVHRDATPVFNPELGLAVEALPESTSTTSSSCDYSALQSTS